MSFSTVYGMLERIQTRFARFPQTPATHWFISESRATLVQTIRAQ